MTTGDHIREKKYVEGRIQGMWPKQAAEHAGYPESVAARARSTLETKSSVQDSLRAAMEKAGITPELLAAKMLEGLDAKRTVYATKDGQITDTREFVDFSERRQHIELAAKLRGDLSDSQVNINVNTVLAQIPAELQAEMVLTPNDESVVDVVYTEAEPTLPPSPKDGE